MSQQQITGQTGALGGNGSLTVYKVPGSALVSPIAASVTFDGTGAAGNFIPCLTFYTQTGAIIARCPAPEVAAGDTAEVSWFPRVGVDLTNYIHFGGNTGPDGQLLDVTVVDTASGYSADFNMVATAGQATLSGTDGTNTGQVQVTPTNVVLSVEPVGSTIDLASDGSVVVEAGTNLIFAFLPTVNPGVTGAVWNNAGVVNIS